MRLKHRFTYVYQPPGAPKVRQAAMDLPADWKRLKMLRASAPAKLRQHPLYFSLRLFITAALVVICLAVISREPSVRDDAVEYLGSLGEKFKIELRLPGESKSAANVREKTSKPLVVEIVPVDFKTVALISDGSVFALGSEGEVRTCGPDCTADRFCVITGVGVMEVPGSMGVLLKAKVDMQVVRAVLRASWAAQLSEIHLGALPEVVIYTRDAIKIKTIDDAHLEDHLKKISAVLSDVRERRLDAGVIDARYQQQIVVKPRLIKIDEAGVRGR